MNKKTLFAKILDYATLFILILILVDFLFSKINLPKVLEYIFILLFSIFLFLPIMRLFKKSTAKKDISKSEEQKLNNTLFALKFGDPQKVEKFFISIFQKKFKVEKSGIFLKLENETETKLVFYNFSKDTLQLEDILNILKEKPANSSLSVLANNYSQDCSILSSNIQGLNLLGGEETFLMLKKLNIFPTLNKKILKKENNFIKIFNSLTRKNSFKFFRYSLLLFALSLIIPFSSYYKIFAIILSLFGVFCLFRKEQTSKNFTSNVTI